MSTPHRVQLSRKKGWRMPSDTVSVARPTRWGNPFKVGQSTHLWHRSAAHPYDFYRDQFTVVSREHAVALFRAVLTDPEKWLDQWGLETGWEDQIRGKNLACWCPLHAPCHGDVLLELANKDTP